MKEAAFVLLLFSVVGCNSAAVRSLHGQSDPAASAETIGEIQLEELLHRLDLLEAEVYSHSPSDAPGNPIDRCADGDHEVMSRMLAFKLMMGEQQKKAADMKYYLLLQTERPDELLPAVHLRKYYYEGLLACVLDLTGTRPRKEREESCVLMLTQSNFEAEAGRGLVLVDFMTHWCGPCKMMAPELENLARHHRGEIRVGRVTVDRNRGLDERFGITSFPTLLLLKDGKEIARVERYCDYPELLRWVRGALPEQSSPSSVSLLRGGQAPAGDVK